MVLLTCVVLIFVSMCSSIDLKPDILSSLESSSCMLTEEELLLFFTGFSPEKEMDDYYLKVCYLLDLRISAKKEYQSKVFNIKKEKTHLLGHFLNMAQPKSIFDDEGASMILKEAIPSFVIDSIPGSYLKDISLSHQISLAFIAKTLPTFVRSPTAEKAYFSLKDLFFLERDPYIPATTKEFLKDEGLAALLAGLAHPAAYHSIKLEHFDLLFPAMANYTEALIFDTLFIFFRHHISLGKNNANDMISNLVLEKSLAYESTIIPDFSISFKKGDSDAVMSFLIYLIHEARREEGQPSEDYIDIAYPGNKVLFKRLQYLRRCSKAAFIGPLIVLVLKKLSRFDIVENENTIGTLTENKDSILNLTAFETLFSEQIPPADPYLSALSKREALVEFLCLNLASFIPFSEKSASFALLEYMVHFETPEEISRILSTYFLVQQSDSEVMESMVKEISRLFIFIIYKYERNLRSEVSLVIENWLSKFAPTFLPSCAPVFLKSTNTTSASVSQYSAFAITASTLIGILFCIY